MHLFENFTENEIVDKILNGEKTYFKFIVKRFNPYLYKVGRSYNLNHQDTQDIMQETFVDAFKNLSQFQGRSDFKTWIIRIMLNNCYHKKHKSSYKNEIKQDLNDNSMPMFTNPKNDTEKIIQNNELGHIIERALGELPYDYRMVFSLREINGLNVLDTANILNISESNVKVRLNRSKALLRLKLEKSYSSQELFEFNLIYCDPMVERVMEKINEI